MIRWLRRRPPAPERYPGIRLRISNMNGELVVADSDHLHWQAQLAMVSQCTPACLPDCYRHGWLDLFAADEHSTIPAGWEWKPTDPRQLRIQIKPIIIERKFGDCDHE